MGQPLLNVGVTAPPAVADKKIVNDSTAAHDNKELKPFSSALNEQVEKQSESRERNKPTKNIEKTDSEAKTAKKSQAEDTVVQDGKIVPKDNETKGDDKLSKQDGADITLTSDLVEASKIKKSSGKLDPKQSTVSLDDNAKDKDKTKLADNIDAIATVSLESPAKINSQETSRKIPLVDGRKQIKASVEQTSNKQVVAQLTVNSQAAEHVDSKPVLRSDILHAIVKQQDVSSQKNEPVVAKEFQVTAEKQLKLPLNAHQKMDKLLSSNNESLVLKTVNNHASNSFSPILSAPATSALPSNNVAPQVSPVSQTILAMQPSVQSAAWGKVLSSRVIWMAKEGIQRAELKLNPASLGPVEVKLHIHNEQANVTFVAHHAATRDSLEQALPRLRESFQDNGMNLADANVSDQASEQQSEGENTDNSSIMNHSSHQENNTEEDDTSRLNNDSGELELGVSVFA